MKKFVILDGHALIYRGYYALPPLHTQKGELVNAVYGFTTILLTILEKMRPDYLAVAFDLKGPTFRDELYADYKAQRPETPDDLIPQVPRIRQVVEAFKIPVFEKEGFEADDVIATLAREAAEWPDLEILVVTGDMDLTQLITDQVKVVTPLSGFNDMKVYDAQAVMDKYGVWPNQIVDYKALKGDTSDNLPGVPGIGEKTAAKLLFQYETLEGVYAHLEEITGAVHDKLAAGKESGYRCYELARLVRNVPVTLDLDACKTHDTDATKVRLLLEELEFKRLIPKFNALQNHWQTIDQPAMF